MKPELVSPAGDFEKFKTAVLYGADAVYVSGTRYGLRASSGNLNDDELSRAVRYAHARGVRVYVTLNAFLHDEDMERLDEYCAFLEREAVDAVIVSDAGVASVAQRSSSLPIHLSTQASCLNSSAARAWKLMGAKRVVLGRETSIQEAAEIGKEAGVETEIFIHGSMCMAYSGRCVLSTYTGGRDANRGGCMHSCRFLYDLETNGACAGKEHYLSSKDLCGLSSLPLLVDYGVAALKIEGRMKSVMHAAVVTSVYRRALDALWSGQWSDELLAELTRLLCSVPHREFTEGFLKITPGAESVYRCNVNTSINASHVFVASVIEIGANFILLRTYQRIEAGDVLSFLSFDGRTLPLEISELRNVLGEKVGAVRQESLALLPIFPGVEPGQIVMRPNKGKAITRALPIETGEKH